MVRGGLVVKEVAFAVPGDLATPTGGYAYDRRIVAGLPPLGWHVDVLDLGDGFPRPTQQMLDAARAGLTAVPRERPIIIDGLAFGVIPELAADLSHTHPLIALVHHPLALESGLSTAEADHFLQRERAALTCSNRVVVTSPATARLLAADYGVSSEHITVVVPGVERRSFARGSSDGKISLLSVGSVVPRKGYDILVTALAGLKDLAWRLTIAGDRSRDPAAAFWLDAAIQRLGLDGRVDVLGAVADDRLADLYDAADLFVLASRFEGYGMAYAEAIAHGVPVVGTSAGAIPETVPPGAGVLVPPDDIEALAVALRRLIEHPDEREGLAAGARAVRFPSWKDQAARFAQVLESLALEDLA
jgi:glycosyltransferase involved in cell wall biosynthesis